MKWFRCLRWIKGFNRFKGLRLRGVRLRLAGAPDAPPLVEGVEHGVVEVVCTGVPLVVVVAG